MNLLAREVEIFLGETDQAAAWQDWLKVRPKYEADRETGLHILIAKLDPGFLANLHPQFPYDNADALRRYCAEEASPDDLNRLFAIGENTNDFWLNHKATEEVRSLIQKAVRETMDIWYERSGNTAEASIFNFITGGLRFFIDPHGTARPLRTRMEFLAYLDYFNGYYADLIAASKLAEIKLLDRKIGQTEYFTGNAGSRTLKAYKNQMMLQIGRSEPHFIETIHPEIPYKQLDDFKAFCTRADTSALDNIFRLATEEDGFWINHKASEQIRTYLKDALTQSAAIQVERNFKSDLASVFAFVVGGLRFFSHERPYFRDRISFSDYLAFLTEHTEYFADRWAKGNQVELKFLDSAIGNTSFFESHGQAAPYIQYLRHVQMCISREDPSFMERIYPEFPHQNLADFKNYVREKASYEDLLKLYEVVTEAESFWLNFKAHAHIKSYLDESMRLTEAIFSERNEIGNPDMKIIFAFVVGGLRFYRIIYGQPVRMETKTDLINYLFEKRNYFGRQNKNPFCWELGFLDKEILNGDFYQKSSEPLSGEANPGGPSYYSKIYAVGQNLSRDRTNLRFENYYNGLIQKPIDLQKQIEFKVFRDQKELTNKKLEIKENQIHVNLGKIIFDLQNISSFSFQVRVLGDLANCPLLRAATDEPQIIEKIFLPSPNDENTESSFRLNESEISVAFAWSPAYFHLRQTEFEIGTVQKPEDWTQKFALELEFESKNIDLQSLSLVSPHFKQAPDLRFSENKISANIALSESARQIPDQAKCIFDCQAALKCGEMAFPLKLTVKIDYPILIVEEVAEGHFAMTSDNGVPIDIRVTENGNTAAEKRSVDKWEYQSKCDGVKDITFYGNGNLVHQAHQVFAGYEERRKTERKWRSSIAWTIGINVVIAIIVRWLTR